MLPTEYSEEFDTEQFQVDANFIPPENDEDCEKQAPRNIYYTAQLDPSQNVQ